MNFKSKNKRKNLKHNNGKFKNSNSPFQSIQDAHTQNIKASAKIPNTPSAPTETPGPHRLQLKVERPEDGAYRAKLEEQKSAEKAMGEQDEKFATPDKDMLTIFQSLTKVMKDNN